MSVVAPYSLFQKQKIVNEKIAQKLERHMAAEARKRTHERLLNWARWHRIENISEIDMSSGAVKVSTLSRLMQSVIGKVSGFDAEEYEEPDEQDALLVREAIYSLGSSKRDNELMWMVHMLYIEQMGYEQIAEEAEWSMKQVKDRVRGLRDRFVGLLS